jgi:CRP-like cAMP-binding protein
MSTASNASAGSATSRPRVPGSSGAAAGTTLFTRSIVRGKHRKGLDIVGESEELDFDGSLSSVGAGSASLLGSLTASSSLRASQLAYSTSSVGSRAPGSLQKSVSAFGPDSLLLAGGAGAADASGGSVDEDGDAAPSSPDARVLNPAGAASMLSSSHCGGGTHSRVGGSSTGARAVSSVATHSLLAQGAACRDATMPLSLASSAALYASQGGAGAGGAGGSVAADTSALSSMVGGGGSSGVHSAAGLAAGAVLTAAAAPPETRAMLRRVLSSHYLFSALAPSELAQVVDCMSAVPVASEELLVRAGDILYNAFFVCERGAFDIYGADGGFLSTVCAGGSFGDSALIYAAPAEHTVRAAELSAGVDAEEFSTDVADQTADEAEAEAGADATATATSLSSPRVDSDAVHDLPSGQEAAGTPLRPIRSARDVTAGLASVLMSPLPPSPTPAGGSAIDNPSAPATPAPGQPSAARGGAEPTTTLMNASARQLRSGASTPAMTPAAGVPPSPVLRVAFEQLHAADHIVWRLDRRTFRRALASTAHRNLAATMDALRSVPLLKPLSEAQLGKLAYAVREVHCSRGQTLIRKGEAGDSLYFLLSGTVVCTDIGSGAAAIADVHLSAGACFGERALLLDEPRGA